MSRILLVNGPNLNLLGQREPAHYGTATLAEIEADLTRRANDKGIALETFQSNAEHAIVERIQQADDVAAIIINAGALTHTSIAIRDALAAFGKPFYEVHISNVYAREPFRHTSKLSDLAAGIIVGCGPIGYGLALAAAVQKISAS